MAGIRAWLRRLEGLTAGNAVTMAQRDGTTRTFPGEAFWLGLFVAASDAACGVVPSAPVVDAFKKATPEARGRIERIAASGGAGDFLRGNGDGRGCWRWPTPWTTSPNRPERREDRSPGLRGVRQGLVCPHGRGDDRTRQDHRLAKATGVLACRRLRSI
jgi:hypothetical protein